MSTTPCFAAPLPTVAPSRIPTGRSVSRRRPARHAALRMDASPAPSSQVASPPQPASTPEAALEEPTPVVWPPPEMTEEWAGAVERLATSVNTATLQDADAALDQADGDEAEALRILTDASWTPIRAKREAAVAARRAAGDTGRVSALKEAELRRRATGSARDFFKGFVEVEGRYVDAGYVDESSDAMGKISGAFKNLFGKKDDK